MAASPITLITSISVLPDYDGPGGVNRYFSLNVIPVASGNDGDTIDPTWLKPWAWPVAPTIDWKIFDPAQSATAFDNNGGPVAAAPVWGNSPNTITASARTSAGWAAFTAMLSDQFDKSGKFWKLDQTPDGTLRWHDILAHTSTSPAPIAQGLGLTYFFSIPKASLPAAASGRLLVALPRLNGTKAGVVVVPAAPAAGSTIIDSKNTLMIMVDPQPAFAVTALFLPIDPTPATGAVPNSLLDVAKGWVNFSPVAPGGYLSLGPDWRTGLENSVADAFNLPTMLMRAYDAGTILTADFGAFIDLVLAVLRDSCDLGLREDPSGICLAELVFEDAFKLSGAAPGPAIDTQAANLLAALANENSSFDLPTWKTFLAANLTALGMDFDALFNPPAGITDKDKGAALHNLVRNFGSDDVLATLVLAQWNQAIAQYLGLAVLPAGRPAIADVNTAWQNVSSYLKTALGQRLLAPRLRLGVIGMGLAGGPAAAQPIWQKIANFPFPIPGVPAPANPFDPNAQLSAFEAEVQTQAIAYFSGRSVTGNPNAPDFYPKVLQNLTGQPALEIAIKASIAGLTNKWTTSPGTTAQDLAETTPHPLIIPVDRSNNVGDDIHAGVGAAPVTTDDLLRQIGGLGLLIRRIDSLGNTSAWRCANLADVYFRTADNPPQEKLLCANVPVPLRVAYLQKLKIPYLTYAGKPMVAASPLALAGQVATGGSASTKIEIVYRPAKQGGSFIPLPLLVYGNDYQVATFIMGTAGALPRELITGPASCTTLAQTTPPTDTPANPSPYLAKIHYARRVLVGPPRFSALKRDATAPSLPAFPSQVTTLATDYKLIGDAGAPPTSTTDRVPANTNDRKLILLWKSVNPNANSDFFSFAVRPPATDLDNWERWVGKSQTAKAKVLRKAVITDYLIQAPQTSPPNDVSINDPSITGFTFSLTQLKPDTTAVASVHVTINYTNFDEKEDADPTPGLYFVQFVKPDGTLPATDRFSVTTTIGDKIDLTLNADGSITAKVPAGVVAELAVTPVFTDDRFDSVVSSANRDKAQLRYLIEVAQGWPDRSGIIPEQEFWNALTFKAGPTTDQPALTTKVSLVPSTAAALPLYLGAHAVALRLQSWRWMGESIEPPPAADYGTPAAFTTARTWEARAFEVRDVTDSTTYENVASWARPASPAPIELPLLTIDETSDLRAKYYRFSLTVRNRYEALPGLENAGPITVQHSPLPDPARKVTTFWKPYFVPTRITDLRAPNVRFAFPLTRAQSTDAPTGFCVVLLENPYDTYGLGIELVPQLLSVKDGADTYLELGADPITTRQGSSTYSGLPIFDAVRGRGLTFDTDIEAPRYHATSYTVNLTADLWRTYVKPNGQYNSLANQATPFGHWFMRLNVLWRLRNEVLASPSQVPTEPAKSGLISPNSPPIDVQMLPHANSFLVNAYKPAPGLSSTGPYGVVDVTMLRLANSGQGKTYTSQDARGVVVDLRPDFSALNGINLVDGTGTVEHRLLLIVTHVETDAFGQESEKFCGLFWSLNHNGTWTAVKNSPSSDPGSNFRGRIMEIQYQKARSSDVTRALDAAVSSDANVPDWTALFFGNFQQTGANASASSANGLPTFVNDTICRCIRMSSPFQNL